ncbi:MAG: RsmB/NOP family class I SAM-dependent RNA methyltransferase [Pseudomonadota bacterium]|nr:RsmB/NOP family class I SAM-dependent RNA methyltransferase [Pseudomonadota bacterium]MEC7236955.1 RsmB/NOP family class I SAM-dependent RNA methyltransferase [Pseudomonadota bacterium]
MTPAARIAAVIEILSYSASGSLTRTSASATLRRGLQARRYAGSGDRQAISALFWGVHRALARLSWHLDTLGHETTGRHLVIAALRLVDGHDAEACKALFSGGDKHAPPPLTESEAGLLDKLDGRELDDAAMPRATRLEWPESLIADAEAALGDSLEHELAAMRGEAGADIRLNPLKITNRHKLRDKLAGRGMACHLTKLSPLGIRMTKRVRTDDTQEFRNGLFEVQDEASQIAALLCDARPGMQVADICAGAAGKSLVMAAAMENRGRIVALDTDPERLERGAVRIRRAGIHNIERVAVSGDWGVKRYRGKFDRVVIDAPCSGSGTWRRAVDARWRCGGDKLDGLRQQQAALLDRGRAMVTPGGRVVYITCSLFHSEGEAQVARLLAEAPELEVADIEDIWQDVIGGDNCPPTSGGMLRLLPGRDGTDGFFMAVLQSRLR